jgi:hypothetical protein
VTNDSDYQTTVDLIAWSVSPSGVKSKIVKQNNLVLAPHFDQDGGPLTLGTVKTKTARGWYEYDCRLADPLTGEEISFDRNFIEVR